MIRCELRTISTHAGRTIAAYFFHPPRHATAAVLIVPAMGVAQKFYAAFATWLASQGYLVATFDYFGVGLSRRSTLRSIEVNITDWAQFDCEAMIRSISAEAEGKQLYWLGHSLGGQIVGLVPSWPRITKVVTIACGSGYWLDNPPSLKWKVWWLWYVAVPVSTRLMGYFPGKRLRKVGDLPRGVIEQWRRWCLDPDYAYGAEGSEIQAQYAAMNSPITSLSFDDDEFMSARNTELLHGYYRSAARIGHFGFFNARFEDSLWRSYLLPELA